MFISEHHQFAVATSAVEPFVVAAVDVASAAVGAAFADSYEIVDFVAKMFVQHEHYYWKVGNEFLFHSNLNAIVDLLNSIARENLGLESYSSFHLTLHDCHSVTNLLENEVGWDT